MKNTNETVQSVLDTLDKDKALDHVAELLVKAFPGPKDVAGWIGDALTMIPSLECDSNIRDEAVFIVGVMAQSLLTEFMEATTANEKTDAAWEFVNIITGDYSCQKKDYMRAIEALDRHYMNGMGGDNVEELRIRIYQFDAMKEIGTLIKK